MNASIYNKELRDSLIERSSFWSLIDDLVFLLEGLNDEPHSHFLDTLEE